MALGVLLLAAGCGSAPAKEHKAAALHAGDSVIVVPAHEPSGWSVEYPITLPGGYASPTGLHEDRDGGGLWFFARGPKQTLFHWSAASGRLTDFTVPSTRRLRAGLWAPIAIDHSGRVWLGINHTLAIVDPKTGILTTLTLPPVSIGAPGSGLPAGSGRGFGRYAAIDALVVTSNGSVVVGREFATELQVVDPGTRDVTTIPLPRSTALVGLGVTDLASFSDGTGIAAALYSAEAVHELGDYRDGSWTLSATPCGAYAVASSSQELVGAGDRCVASGPSASPVPMTLLRVRGLPEAACARPVGDLTIACVRGGVAAVTVAGQSGRISLGWAPRGSSSGGGGESGSPPDPKTLVPVSAAITCTGWAGQMWFVPDRGPAQIGLLTHHVS